MRKFILTLMVVVVCCFEISADVKPPKPTPKPVDETTALMYIDLKSDAKVPTLKIRRETLRQLRAAIDEADDAQDNTAAVSRSIFSRTRTIVSGTLFSLAFAFGGIWLFRHHGRSSRIAMSIAVFAALGTGAMFVFANTPPPTFISLTTNIFDKQTKQYGYAAGTIKIQILDRVPGVYTGNDSNDVILEIPGDGGRGE